MKVKQWAKTKALLYTLVAVLLLTALVNPLWFSVDESHDGYALLPNGEGKRVTMTIQGRYGWQILSADVLELQVECDGTVWSLGEISPSGTVDEGTNGASSRYYTGQIRHPIFKDAPTELLLITPYEEDVVGTVYVCPATTEAEARILLSRYAPSSPEGNTK